VYRSPVLITRRIGGQTRHGQLSQRQTSEAGRIRRGYSALIQALLTVHRAHILNAALGNPHRLQGKQLRLRHVLRLQHFEHPSHTIKADCRQSFDQVHRLARFRARGGSVLVKLPQILKMPSKTVHVILDRNSALPVVRIPKRPVYLKTVLMHERRIGLHYTRVKKSRVFVFTFATIPGRASLKRLWFPFQGFITPNVKQKCCQSSQAWPSS
jgi:hypothetical protein